MELDFVFLAIALICANAIAIGLLIGLRLSERGPRPVRAELAALSYSSKMLRSNR